MNTEKAEQIVFELLHGGSIDDFRKRLPKRPDWQASIDRLQMEIERRDGMSGMR